MIDDYNHKEQLELRCCYNCRYHSYDCDKELYCTIKRISDEKGGTKKYYVFPTDVCDKFI